MVDHCCAQRAAVPIKEGHVKGTRRGSRRVFACAVAVAALAAAALPSAAQAGAGVYWYGLLYPDQWSPQGVDALITYNRAVYYGSGTVRVGIRQTDTWGTSYGEIFNRKFADNYVSTNSSARRSLAQAANASGNRHTIEGYAQWCDGCQLARASSRGRRARRAAYEDELRAQRAELGVLRRARRSYDAPSDRLAADPASRQFGWTRTDMRRAFAGPDGDDYYVVPGVRVCVFRDRQGSEVTGTCNRTAAIERGDVTIVEELDGGRVRVFGLAPDGVERVAIGYPGRPGAATANVAGNVFAVVLEADAADVPVVTFER
jgi:hypothetical protein